MRELEKGLRDYAAAEFDRLDGKYPEEKLLLSQLRTLVLTGLVQHCSDMSELGDFIDGIQDEGGKLDVSADVYSELYGFQDGLRKRVRKALSKGSVTFPSLSVRVMSAQQVNGKGKTTRPKRGQRTKLGGRPDWIQGEEMPICSNCSRPMTFVGQIDSIGASETKLGRSLAKTEAFVFADGAMIYVFWCKGCNDTRSVLQSY